jgi:hypothetical protein
MEGLRSPSLVAFFLGIVNLAVLAATTNPR